MYDPDRCTAMRGVAPPKDRVKESLITRGNCVASTLKNWEHSRMSCTSMPHISGSRTRDAWLTGTGRSIIARPPPGSFTVFPYTVTWRSFPASPTKIRVFRTDDTLPTIMHI